jgi:alkylation response protein AidB-like acyl-CoA dehydrogenase
MEKIISITGEYVRTRVQFGQPIGKFQSIQHYLADMFVEVQESRSALYRGMAYMEAGAAQRAKAVSAAKVTIARAGKVVGALGIQLHGGYGMTEEYPVGHYFRYLTAFEKKYGDLGFHLKRMSTE